MREYGSVPDITQIQQFSVNRPGQVEVNRQTLYDFQTYANAGQTQLTFFQTPNGSGGKTLADTNMEMAGVLPNPKMFLVQSIEVLFFPGPSSTNTNVAVSNGPLADAQNQFINDIYNVGKSGWLEFFIGSKPYLREAPINRFPPKTKLDGFASITSTLTAGAATMSQVVYSVWSGRPYYVQPPILLKPTQNFNITLNWPAAIALGAADTAARIGIVLDGILYRNSQ